MGKKSNPLNSKCDFFKKGIAIEAYKQKGHGGSLKEGLVNLYNYSNPDLPGFLYLST